MQNAWQWVREQLKRNPRSGAIEIIMAFITLSKFLWEESLLSFTFAWLMARKIRDLT